MCHQTQMPLIFEIFFSNVPAQTKKRSRYIIGYIYFSFYENSNFVFKFLAMSFSVFQPSAPSPSDPPPLVPFQAYILIRDDEQ